MICPYGTDTIVVKVVLQTSQGRLEEPNLRQQILIRNHLVKLILA